MARPDPFFCRATTDRLDYCRLSRAVSNISRPLTQTDNKRPFEAGQELIIRVREGLTKRIYDHATSSRDSETTLSPEDLAAPLPLKAWSEGPYGHQTYFGEDFNTLLLVAGGSGVSYSLSSALDLVRRARAMHHGVEDAEVAIATKRLSFLWMVKKPGELPTCPGPSRRSLVAVC